MKSIDVIAFAPHPDDAELYCSGTLLGLKHAGKSIGIIDLTKGELSTRGTPERRAQETATASAILTLDLRTNLGLPDGHIENNPSYRRKVVETIRTYRPEIVLVPYHYDRHPDHVHASALITDALFFSGVEKWKTEGAPLPPHRPRSTYFYQLALDFDPDILVDITPWFETKMAAIGAYASQFHISEEPLSEDDNTYISSRGFMEAQIARSRRLGFLAGSVYAEGLKTTGPLAIAPDLLMRI